MTSCRQGRALIIWVERRERKEGWRWKKDKKLGKEEKLEKIRRNQRPSPSIVSQKPPISTLVRPMMAIG